MYRLLKELINIQVFSFSGPNWTVVSGCPEGQTVSGKLDYEKTVVWAHPLDIHYVTKGIQGTYVYSFDTINVCIIITILFLQFKILNFSYFKISGWPKLLVQVSCLDSIGRSWIVGYGCSNLPAVPGPHIINVNCWVPSTTSITDRIRQYFLGGSHQLIQSDIVNLGLNR